MESSCCTSALSDPRVLAQNAVLFGMPALGYEEQLARLLFEQNRYADAEAAYRLALLQHAEDAALHLGLGNCILNDGRPDEALVTFQRAAALDPTLAEAFNGAGICDPDIHTAEEFFRNAVKLDPGCAEFHSNLAICLLRQQRLEDAEACLRMASALAPDNLGLLADYAALLTDMGRLRDAETTFRRATMRIGDCRLFLNRKAWWCYEEGRFREADDRLEALRAGSHRPDEAWVYHGYGRLLLLKGDPARATKAFRIAIGLLPHKLDFHLELANALEADGDDRGATRARVRADQLKRRARS